MRVGIDCRTMLDWTRGGEAAGIGHYTFYLVEHILKYDRNNEYVLFLDRQVNARLRSEAIGDNAKVRVEFLPFRSVRKAVPFVWGQMMISGAFERAGLDLLHAPANALPLFYRGPAVVTVHDLAVYDHPEWFPSPYRGALSFAERVIVPYSMRQARHIIAVSKQTKEDVRRIFGLPGERVSVIYEGAEGTGHLDASVPERYGLSGRRYLLFLGTVEPRKNIPAAVRAFASVLAQDYGRFADIDLVIAGRRGWGHESSFEAIAAANAAIGALAARHGDDPRERVRYAGYVSRDDKAGLMAGAAAFVFPSLYEGFGLPVVEAMKLGVPVITARRASLPEVCGDCAVLVDPENDGDLARAMKEVLEEPDKARALAERGRARAGEFSWERTARETVRVYEEAVMQAVPLDTAQNK
jgi:glycosyltransferase involved in cell wall biosynthesis